LATLGAVSIPRETYVRRVARALDVPLPKAFT
jgi:leucyl/phenylalanyl-tRNA--protein transferase